MGIIKILSIDKTIRHESLRKSNRERKREKTERKMSSSVSSIFGCGVAIAPNSLRNKTIRIERRNACGGLLIECSSRPQKKSTAHHMKTRPRKSTPSDRNRKPTEYAPLPLLPPDFTVVIPADASVAPPPPTPSA
jgi:50S ribosomal protein 6